jgi:hypothetical protein
MAKKSATIEHFKRPKTEKNEAVEYDNEFKDLTSDSQEQLSSQNEQLSDMMSKTVLVTLDEAYLGDPEKTVVLTWGRDRATATGPQGNMSKEYVTFTGSGILSNDGEAFMQPRWVPGKWRHYHLRMNEGPLGKCSCGMDPDTKVGPTCYMPQPVAIAWFGDWNVLQYELSHNEGQTTHEHLTRKYHADRVATDMWGGYVHDLPIGLPAHDARGALNYRAFQKFECPPIPHVSIVRMDSMHRRLPNTMVKPWEIFKWEDQLSTLERSYLSEAKPRDAAANFMQVTEGQFADAVAKAVEAQMAKMFAAQMTTKK